MAIKSKDNIISIKQWKARASLKQGAMRQGWNVTPLDLAEITRPATFYICEPLITGFTAFSVFDRSGFENLVKNGVKKFGSPQQIFEAVATVTMDLLDANAIEDVELMEAVMNGHLINFAGTQTAAQVSQDKNCCHFGCLIYRNPLRKDGVNVTFRPMALSEKSEVLSKDNIFLAAANYMFHDKDNHPDYFEGVDMVKCLSDFAGKLGVDMSKFFE